MNFSISLIPMIQKWGTQTATALEAVQRGNLFTATPRALEEYARRSLPLEEKITGGCFEGVEVAGVEVVAEAVVEEMIFTFLDLNFRG